MNIKDEHGKTIVIGMRVGCRNIGESRSNSRRGLTLTGYELGQPRPYITNAGRFDLVIKDHQPDMEEWIAKQSTHGGPRKGAGRKKGSGKGRTSVTRSVSMPEECWRELDLQRGTMSRGKFIQSRLQ